MKGLLIKDFKLIAAQKKFFLTILFIAIIMYASIQQESVLMGYLIVMFTLLAATTVSYDEFDNGYAFLFTLPVSRKMYVLEKYLFGLLTGGIGCVFSCVIVAAEKLLTGKSFPVGENLFVAGSLILVSLCMLAVKIPIQLKFGSEKGRIANLGVMVVFFFAVVGMVRFVTAFHLEEKLENGILSASNAILIVFAVLYLVFFAISCLISIKIMEKKEF